MLRNGKKLLSGHPSIGFRSNQFFFISKTYFDDNVDIDNNENKCNNNVNSHEEAA